VPVDRALLGELCAATLERTHLGGIGRRVEGKVRDSYVREGERTIVVTDRVSCFDVVVGTIPVKGQVLNRVAAFWFDRTRAIVPNHLLAVPDPNVSVVREVEVLPVEFVMRGYLTGVSATAIWTAYERGVRDYCGHRLPDGLRKHERLPAPLLTPTTKAPHGGHDELTSRDELLARGVVDEATWEAAAAIARRLFADGQAWAAERGLILVDTKYEIGRAADGTLIVADEIHTPDSSRYWYADGYERALAAGEDPRALDKEYVRRWLARRGYRGEGAPPPLPTEVRVEAATRYVEAYERVTGTTFVPDLAAPEPRIRAALGAT
jgi:phosphoribosylaminoimidazole-succinocarboxamide synthase